MDIKAKQLLLVDLGYNIGTTGKNKNGVDGDWRDRSEKAWNLAIKDKKLILMEIS